MNKKNPPKQESFRSSKSGRFVTERYARSHPEGVEGQSEEPGAAVLVDGDTVGAALGAGGIEAMLGIERDCDLAGVDAGTEHDLKAAELELVDAQLLRVLRTDQDLDPVRRALAPLEFDLPAADEDAVGGNRNL